MSIRNDLLENLFSQATGLIKGKFAFTVNQVMADGDSFDLAVSTDNKNLVLSDFTLNSNSDNVRIEIFEGATFTGGAPITPEPIDRTQAATFPDVQFNPLVTDDGIMIFTSTHFDGRNSGFSRAIGSAGVIKFKQNTSYITRVINQSNQPGDVEVGLAGYEE